MEAPHLKLQSKLQTVSVKGTGTTTKALHFGGSLPGTWCYSQRPSNVFLKPVSKLLGYTLKSRGRSSASGGGARSPPSHSSGGDLRELVKYAWLFRSGVGRVRQVPGRRGEEPQPGRAIWRMCDHDDHDGARTADVLTLNLAFWSASSVCTCFC